MLPLKSRNWKGPSYMRVPGICLVEQTEQKFRRFQSVLKKKSSDCNSRALLLIKAPTKNTFFELKVSYICVVLAVWNFLLQETFLRKISEFFDILSQEESLFTLEDPLKKFSSCTFFQNHFSPYSFQGRDCATNLCRASVTELC